MRGEVREERGIRGGREDVAFPSSWERENPLHLPSTNLHLAFPPLSTQAPPPLRATTSLFLFLSSTFDGPIPRHHSPKRHDAS